MKRNKYVISIKKIKDCTEENIFEYAGLDDYNGAFSTGYPCFSFNENHAKRFNTKESAVEWWNKNKKYLIEEDIASKYDLSTLAVRKVCYNKVATLEI